MAKKPGPYKFTETAQDAAVRAMEETGNHAAAAEACGLSINWYYKKIGTTHEAHPEFRERIHEAKARFVRKLEAEAIRRAVEGWDEDRVGPGGMLYSVRKFSDPLLLHLLKKKAPEEHGDKIEVEQRVSGSLSLAGLSPESRDLLRQIIEKEISGDSGTADR